MAVHNEMEIDAPADNRTTLAKQTQRTEEDSQSNSSASSPTRIQSNADHNPINQNRRKERVSQRKKTKCDAKLPECDNCKERGTNCVYATAVPKKPTDVQLMDMYHPLVAVKGRLVDLQMVARTSVSSLATFINNGLSSNSHEILSSFEMPSKHSATVSSLVLHFPDIREAAEVPSISKAEHFASPVDHCPSSCSSCARILNTPEAEGLFDSFLQKIFIFYPFLNAQAAWTAFDLVLDQERTAQSEHVWREPLDQPIGLLIFALGALCRRGTNTNLSCCASGKKYFTRATRILEYHIGSTKLQFVQAWLLAAIYMSLLNDMQRSFWCLRKASGSLLAVLQDYPEVFDGNNIDEQANTIRLTYWTWFQLESDLLSDVCHRPSETFAYAHQIPLPGILVNKQSDGLEFHDVKPKINTLDSSFAVQRFLELVKLRKILNRIHCTLYSSSGLEQPSELATYPTSMFMEPRTEASSELWAELQEWRKGLHPALQWSRNNYSPSHITDACLREKYYRACILATRPCLQRLRQLESGESNLSFTEFDQSELEGEAVAQTQGLTNSTDAASRIAYHLNMDYTVVLNAARCVAAAKESVIVFANVPFNTGNLITPNVFGIMQAIYINIRLLYSLRQHIGYLSNLIQVEELRYLLPKTIHLFESCSAESAEIRKNVKMIRDILHNLNQ